MLRTYKRRGVTVPFITCDCFPTRDLLGDL
jgi:hypothetical protein